MARSEDIEMQENSSGETSGRRRRPSPDNEQTPRRRAGTRQREQDETSERPSRDTNILRRKLNQHHVRLIVISSLIGMGFYVKTGTILRTGGPAAVTFSYFFVGILALMVLQGLSTMLRVWPVPGALTLFVEKFVDEEVAQVVTLMYWLTYCFSFASIVISIGDLFDYEALGFADESRRRPTSIGLSVLTILVPILINLTDIAVFKRIEVFFGCLKLLLACIVILTMFAINHDVGSLENNIIQTNSTIHGRDHVVFKHKENLPCGWFFALMSSTLISSFAFVGIETVTATAQEAIVPPPSNTSTSPNTRSASPDRTPTASGGQASSVIRDNPFGGIMWVSSFVTLIYLAGGWIVSENVAWNDQRLSNTTSSINSVFVLSILDSGNLGKASSDKDYRPATTSSGAATVLLIINLVSTSSTMLYVASRTLFGFAYTITRKAEVGGVVNEWFMWPFRKLSTTSDFNVPYCSVLISAWMLFLPFVKYGKDVNLKRFDKFTDITGEVTSVGCIIVWATLSQASLVFYTYYQAQQGQSHVPSFLFSPIKERHWYSPRIIASWLSIFFCLIIICLGGIATFYVEEKKKRHLFATYGVLICFFLAIYSLKFIKWLTGHKSTLHSWLLIRPDVDLNKNAESVFAALDDKRKHTTETTYHKERAWLDFGGIINSEWLRNKFRGIP